MQSWARFSPDESSDRFIAPYSLETCLTKDPAYRRCDTEEGRIQNFGFNGKINMARNKRILAELNPRHYPTQLAPVVQFLRGNLEFYIWREEQRLTFLETGNRHALEAKFRGIDPRRGCSTEINKTAQETDPVVRYKAATFDWGNCVNGLIRKKLGEYPTTHWKEFLKSYGIIHLIEYEVRQ